ncbi:MULTISPECIES: cytochrome P450 [unclassified Roseitalea]|uniref:cytochrome P450 n=1 Tax=unclassified Roseitalea TaxID=2639107 RepID=UPI00273F1368|nr:MULTISPECIES: cytochrome P450 [unclassified Roseitalea]
MQPQPASTATAAAGSGDRLSIDPRANGFIQDPYPAYARIHARSPAFFWEQYGHWCLAGYQAVDALLRDRRFGRQILHVATRAELGWPERPAHLRDFDALERHSLLELEAPAHTKLRRLITKAFVARQVERLRPQVRALCHRLIDGFEADGSAELLAAYATPIPLETICRLLGVPVSAGPQLLDWSHAIVKMYVLAPTMDAQIAANAAARDFAAFLRDHIAARRAAPGDDLLSALIAAEDGGATLSEDELVSTVVLLLNAGHEATVHQIGNALHSILDSGLDPTALFGSPEATAASVEEALRHNAPLHMFTRYALSDIDLDVEGRVLPLRKGERIGLLLGAANRDPRRFAAPHAFDPGRADQANVSFGAGIHFCIGAPLARIEIQEALSVLFARLPGLRFAERPRYGDTYHFRGLERAAIKW